MGGGEGGWGQWMYQPSGYPLSAINYVSPLMSGVHVMNRFPRQSIYGIHVHQATSVVVSNQPLGLPVQGCYTHPPPPYGHIRSAREVQPSRLVSQDRTHCLQRPVAHSLSSVSRDNPPAPNTYQQSINGHHTRQTHAEPSLPAQKMQTQTTHLDTQNLYGEENMTDQSVVILSPTREINQHQKSDPVPHIDYSTPTPSSQQEQHSEIQSSVTTRIPESMNTTAEKGKSCAPPGQDDVAHSSVSHAPQPFLSKGRATEANVQQVDDLQLKLSMLRI